MEFWGAWKGAVIRKSSTGEVLVDLVAHFWRPARDSLKVSVQVGAKMCAREAKLGPSWQQGATKMGHDSAKLVILGSTWEVLGAFWGLFWHMGWIAQTYKNLWKTCFFLYFGVPGGGGDSKI